jgi:DNA-binding IclR family transcriptional regulator
MRTDLPPADDIEARALIRRAFDRQPAAGFTAEGLASMLALPVATVRRVLDDLLTIGLVLQVDGEFVSAVPED